MAVNREERAGSDDATVEGLGEGAASDARANAPEGGAAGTGEGAGEAWGADGRSLRAQARREQRRSLILAAATQVFRDKGYHATSVGDIIDAAQIARGTFYLYFTNKREIFAALSAGFLDLIRGSVRKISLDPESGEPLAQMRANFRRVIHTVLGHEDLATIVLRDDALDAEAREQIGRFYAQVTALIGQAVRVGHRLGIARECDERIIAVSALGALKEILTRMLADRRGGEPLGVGPPEPSAAPSTAPSTASGARGDSPESWPLSSDPDHVADELLSFFVRGVFTGGAR